MAVLRSISICSIIVSLAASLSLLPSGSAATDFHQWCERTTHRGTCIVSILEDPRSNLKTDPNGFCTILNDKAKAIAAAAASKIADLIKSFGSSTAEKQALRSCSDAYDKANFLLSQVNFTVLNQQTYSGLTRGLSEVFDEASNCENSFTVPTESPLTAENQVLMNIAETAAEILNLNECDKVSVCNL